MIVTLALLLVPAAPSDSPLLDERVVVVARDAGRGALVEAALRARGLRLIDDAERAGLDGRDTRTAPGDRERVRTRLLAGRAAWRELDLDAASRAADDAFAEAVRLERPEDHRELLVDILLLQASLALGRNGDDAARRPLQLATRLEPGREDLDPALHPPSLVAAWRAARDAPGAAHVVVIRPRVVGGGAAVVLVNGQPTAVRDGLLELPPGLHLVTVRAPGCRSHSRVVDVGAADVAVEDVLIPDDEIAARVADAGRLATGDLTALTALRTRTGVDVVVALDVPVGGASRVVGARAPLEPVVVDVDVVASPTAIAEGVLRALAPPRGPVEAFEEEPPPLATGLLVAGVVGGVAAMLGGGATLAWLLWPGEPPPPPARPVVVTCCTQ